MLILRDILLLDIQSFTALFMSYVIKYGFFRLKVGLDKFLMLKKANKLAFSSLNRNFTLTLQPKLEEKWKQRNSSVSFQVVFFGATS